MYFGGYPQIGVGGMKESTSKFPLHAALYNSFILHLIVLQGMLRVMSTT